MEDSSLQHISTYQPLEQEHEIIMTRGKLGGIIGSRQREYKQTACSSDAYELLVLRIIS